MWIFFFLPYDKDIWTCGSRMWVFRWTPDFALEDQTTVIPVWVLLLNLQQHLTRLEALKQILDQTGTCHLRPSNSQESGPKVAKARPDVNLTMPLHG